MTVSGGLIAESLRTGSVLEGVTLTVKRVSRADVGDVDAGQPLTWTFLDFEVDDDQLEPLAAALSQALETKGGWYCDFRNDQETFVVFSGRVFHYPRGDLAGRARVTPAPATVTAAMARVTGQLSALWPALAFLLAGVPLAALLDRLGFFESAAAALAGRRERGTPVLGLWVLAALTTVVLNLDTTVVLLTPLYLRLARRTGADPVALAAVPLLLAAFASSVLPVSNLTTLIAADRLHIGPGAMAAHLGAPCLAATTVGWLLYRRRYPTRLAPADAAPPDRHALRIGGVVVGAILVGFVVGPGFGVAPWMTAAAADVLLVAIMRAVPWRSVPVVTAAGVAAVAVLAAITVPSDAFTRVLSHTSPAALAGLSAGAAGAANLVNNLPALLLAVDGVHRASWGMWAWLLGVNAGAVLLPAGALANLLWLRVVRADGRRIGLRQYAQLTFPIAIPAFLAAVATLLLERALAG